MNETRISISKTDLQNAANGGSMSPLDVEPLWQALTKTQSTNVLVNAPEATRLDIAQLSWYGGGVLVMIAMTWFMSRAADMFGMGGVLTLSLLYTAGFVAFGQKLLKQGVRTPAGVLHTLAVLMTPVTLTALLSTFKLDHFLTSSGGALTIEIATAAVGVFALSKVKTTLLSAPVYGAFWCISMTVAWIITTGSGTVSGLFAGFDHYNLISMAIGLIILMSAVYVDGRFGRAPGSDYSWWGYFFGVAAFWIPLSLIQDGGELGKLVYFGLNILLMLSSVLLARRVMLVAGALGSIYYVGHILWTFFSDSLAFPVMLIAVGLAVIYLGIQYRRRQADIENVVLSWVPASWQKVLPRRP